MFCTRKYKIKKLDSAIKNNFMVTKSLCSFESSSGTILATVWILVESSSGDIMVTVWVLVESSSGNIVATVY